jgi:uncharacterized protein
VKASDRVTQPVRTFGRARGLSRRLRLMELTLAKVYGAGWAAAVARRLGLQPNPRLRAHTVRVRRREASAPPLRVGFAADFHAGPTTHPDVLRRACDELAAARPDVLLLAGDFVELHARHVDRLVPLLAAVPAPLGRYAVLGNHDVIGDDAYVAARLRAAGVEVLTNRAVRLPRPHEDVWLCGLDDPTRGEARAECALDGVPGIRVVLMHSPDGLLTIGGRPFDLALCGHTHGGQVALPGGRPLVVPEGDLSRRFLRGLFCLGPDGGRALLVSRGVGCSTVPVRLFAGSEVHVCTLVGEAVTG